MYGGANSYPLRGGYMNNWEGGESESKCCRYNILCIYFLAGHVFASELITRSSPTRELALAAHTCPPPFLPNSP
jgi:hypothetical protein